MTLHSTVLPSPVGPLLVHAEGDRLVGLHTNPERPPAARDDEHFAELAAQLDAYFAGERTRFDVPLQLHGTEFERRVWNALLEIPYGETAGYGEIAREIGAPGAARAVGRANGRNPIAIVVPCHRVIGADGSLTGYGGGLPLKRALLDLERGLLTLGGSG